MQRSRSPEFACPCTPLKPSVLSDAIHLIKNVSGKSIEIYISTQASPTLTNWTRTASPLPLHTPSPRADARAAASAVAPTRPPSHPPSSHLPSARTAPSGASLIWQAHLRRQPQTLSSPCQDAVGQALGMPAPSPPRTHKLITQLLPSPYPAHFEFPVPIG